MPWYDRTMKRYTRQEAVTSPKDLKVKRPTIAFVPGGITTGNRSLFENPPIDFSTISDAYRTDSYIRQALDKYIYLMFKEGYELSSKNQNAVDYIKRRLELMAACTGTPTQEMLVEIAATLVRDANVFIAKARQDLSFKPNGVNIKPVPNMGKPIAGYFVQSTSTVTIARDLNGQVNLYRITVPGTTPKDMKPDDMIHIYYDREPGQAFAVPFVWEVLNDVQLLRQLEEIVARMVYKETFPLRDVAVGSDEEGKYASQEEIDDAKAMVDNMKEDGWAVHGGHIKIDVLGGQGEALNAEPYLRYYESRVFSGLGVSAVMMGRGEGASRSTADNMTDQMFDRILGLQSVLEENISQKMFFELLLEGGFDPLNNPDDMVYLNFNPVDINQLIKYQLFQLQLFQGNMKSIDEVREECKLTPATDDLSRFYSNLFKIPEMQAQAQAQAAASAAQAGTGTGSSSSVGNKNQPTNQHGKKAAPTRAKNSEIFLDKIPSGMDFYDYCIKQYEFIREDINKYIKNHYGKDTEAFRKDIQMMLWLAKDNIKKQADKTLLNAFIHGVETTRKKLTPYTMPAIRYTEALVRLNDTFDKNISRLTNDIEDMAVKSIQTTSEVEAVAKMNAFIDSVKYRLSFMARTDISRAYNYGVAVCGKSLGKENVKVITTCPQCKDFYPELISLSGDFYNQIPPACHPNCDCELEVV